MRCWKKSLKFCLGLYFILATMLASAGGIAVRSATLEPLDDSYALSANFDLQLGAPLEAAVERGVSLNFIVEFSVEQPRWYWLNDRLASRRIEYQLDYQVLTRRYRLAIGGLAQYFDSLSAALRVMSRIVNLRVIKKDALVPGKNYEAIVQLKLDRSRLPKPLQVDALANRDWQLESKPLIWEFQMKDAGGELR